MWERLRDQLLDVIFPPRCGGCGSFGRWVCSDCQAQLALVSVPLCYRCGRLSPGFRICPGCCRPGGLSRLLFCGYWQDPLRRLILGFKYRRLRALAGDFSRLMWRTVSLLDAGFDVVVPVPLHRGRLWQRGFNQAAVLANELSRVANVPVRRWLVRGRATRPQFTLAKPARADNVAGAFSLRSGASVAGQVVMLVDDVTATGSTLEECAKILRQKGAKQVWGLVIARA